MRAKRLASGVVLGALVAVACGNPTEQARGLVVDVVAETPADVSRFSLRDGSGQVLTFEVGQLEVGGDAFPAAHLREHLTSGEPVEVTFRREGGRLVAVRLRDAPGGSAGAALAAVEPPPLARRTTWRG